MKFIFRDVHVDSKCAQKVMINNTPRVSADSSSESCFRSSLLEVRATACQMFTDHVDFWGVFIDVLAKLEKI